MTPHILLDLKDDVLRAEVVLDSSDKNSYDFAFYLYRNGNREEVRWYSSDRSVSFNISPGIAKIRAFIKRKDDGERSSFWSDKVRYAVPTCDYSNWGGVYTSKVSDFLSNNKINNGCHLIDIDGMQLDLLIRNVDNNNVNRSVLVCFSGAITDRYNKVPPFFSGINIANNLGMPLISISDPSLGLSNKLSLGWYAGNSGCKDLSVYIAKILDHIGIALDSKLVLFGGSGGGFAALSVIEIMQHDACAAIWNPQTSITNYHSRAVSNYIKVCLPYADDQQEAYGQLQYYNIRHDLCSIYNKSDMTKKTNILYIQNEGDRFHLKNHALPFMEAVNAKKHKENIYYNSQGISFWYNYWGDGHLVPSGDIITFVLDKLSSGHSSFSISQEMNDKFV